MDAKLIQARGEIDAILKKHDIAAYVFLHNAPGKSEVFSYLTPSYSKLAEVPAPDGNIGFRVRSKLADYGGDKEAQRRDLAATANMVSSMAMLMGTTAMPLLSLAAFIDEKIGAEHTPMERDEGTSQ